MKAFIFSVFIIVFLSGCADSRFGSARSGGAVYEYAHRGSDGSDCSIRVTSARDVGKGSVRIAQDCSLSTDVDDVGGSDGAYEVMKGLVEKIPSVPFTGTGAK